MTTTEPTTTESTATESTAALPLRGKTALVGAGAKNLGGLISRQLAAQGANVVVHYHSEGSRSAAEEVVADVKKLGGRAVIVSGDLSVPDRIVEVFDAAAEAFGGLDIAVNTVGKVLRKPIAETSEDEYDQMFDVNSKAAFFFLREAGKRVADNGSIITIVTSLLAAYTDGYSTYAGSKSPVEHFTRAASKELAARQIAVNAIAPGPMDTPFFYPQETPSAWSFISRRQWALD